MWTIKRKKKRKFKVSTKTICNAKTLCSKCYFVDEQDSTKAHCWKCYFEDEQEREKKELSTKGMTKNQNSITWQRFEAALKGSKDMATNRGFCVKDEQMVTYKQKKLVERVL